MPKKSSLPIYMLSWFKKIKSGTFLEEPFNFINESLEDWSIDLVLLESTVLLSLILWNIFGKNQKLKIKII